MINYNLIKDKFLNRHRKIDDHTYLDKYINLLLNYKLKKGDIYTENHHILPISTFPEFKNEKWNIVELDYEDHKIAHLWLFKSINIRKYQRPLNWMLNYHNKNREELSNAAKNGWINLKNDKRKYKDWRDKKSLYMKGLSSDEQRRRVKIFWDNISDDDYLKFCNKMKEYWTYENKLKKSKYMKKFYSDPLNKIKKSEESKKIWDSRSEEERNRFKEKMNVINKDDKKRKSAGDKIKKLWKDDEYIKKMNERKHRSGVKLKVTKPCGEEIIFNNMKEMTNKYNFSPYLIRKYRDTGTRVLGYHLKGENNILLGCLIESI